MYYKLRTQSKTRKGFTLIELLTVISIIGILSTVATVSLTSVRVRGRDTRRLADMRSLREALEFYSTFQGGYPGDTVPGTRGLVVGGPDAQTLTESGWGEGGKVILQGVPKNPPPYGADYEYHSLNTNDSPCDFGPCKSFRLEFFLEADVLGFAAGPYILTPAGTVPAPLGIAQSIINRTTFSTESVFLARAKGLIQAADQVRAITIDNPQVEAATEIVVAPASVAVVAANAVTALSFAQLGRYFYLLISQPFLLLRKKRQYAWGIVYNSASKLPVDLAIVRLVNDATKRVVQTRVTDHAGRIFFFAGKGTYRMEVAKPGFEFPSKVLAGATEDGKFGNLYLGARFTVAGDGQAVNPSIPLDPAGAEVSDVAVIKRYVKRQLQHTVALSGFFVSLGTLAVKPSVWIGSLAVVHLIFYLLFRRLSVPRQPQRWGVVRDEQTKKPVSHAVVRIFSLPYNKLLETRVTDRHGRYNFLVGQNLYYLTISHPKYWKTETHPLDLRSVERPEVIAAPLLLRPKHLPPVDSAAQKG